MFIRLVGLDDKGNEFNMYLNMERIDFTIDEEKAVTMSDGVVRLTDDSYDYLTAFLKQTWFEN